MTTQEAIQEANQSKARILRAFENTPDDKLNWSPAPTARTPIELVAHSAFSLGYVTKTLQGSPYPAPTMAQADKELMEMDKTITSREQALELFEKNFSLYVNHVGSITEDQFGTMITMPFSLGEVPLGAILDIGAGHTRDHAAQLEYLQTCYGDRNW